MIYTRSTWPKGRWPNFTFSEMVCKETGECDMDEAFMDSLQELRVRVEEKLRVTSGFRSIFHSIEADKRFPGAHPKGMAADILAAGGLKHKILEHAFQMGFTGIGIAPGFIHLDRMDETFHAHRPTVWCYPTDRNY